MSNEETFVVSQLSMNFKFRASRDTQSEMATPLPVNFICEMVRAIFW